MPNIPITVTIPNALAVAQGAVVSTIIGRTQANGKPLPVVLPELNIGNSAKYLGVPALTELAFQYEGKKYYLNDCIMVVSTEKEIITTKLAGRNGTVKEYVSDGDYTIDVTASITGDYMLSSGQTFGAETDYPLQEMALFIKILKAQITLDVTSDWLALFNIKSVVIKNYNFPQETFSNSQNFTMTMLSDEPYEIKLLKDA